LDGFRSISIESSRICPLVKQLPFSNIAPFVKIRKIQPVKLRAEICPFF
jgi:hypothetical protein